MAKSQLRVNLPTELADFVSDRVRSGDYAGQDEVIRDGLELLRSLEGYRTEKLKELSAAFQVGIDQADQGLGRPWDQAAGDRIKTKGRRLLATRKSGKK